MDGVGAVPAGVGADDDPYEEETTPRTKKKRAGGGMDPVQMFNDYGGVSTLLFAFGAFLIIVFLFSPLIGDAAVDRARGAEARAKLELEQKIEKARKVDKKTDEDINKMRDEFNEKKAPELKDNINYARISQMRDLYFDRYGMMLGFLFLMVGSLGFMGPGQSLIRRIVGATVITAQMLIVFLVFSGFRGCGGPTMPTPNSFRE